MGYQNFGELHNPTKSVTQITLLVGLCLFKFLIMPESLCTSHKLQLLTGCRYVAVVIQFQTGRKSDGC